MMRFWLLLLSVTWAGFWFGVWLSPDLMDHIVQGFSAGVFLVAVFFVMACLCAIANLLAIWGECRSVAGRHLEGVPGCGSADAPGPHMIAPVLVGTGVLSASGLAPEGAPGVTRSGAPGAPQGVCHD